MGRERRNDAKCDNEMMGKQRWMDGQSAQWIRTAATVSQHGEAAIAGVVRIARTATGGGKVHRGQRLLLSKNSATVEIESSVHSSGAALSEILQTNAHRRRIALGAGIAAARERSRGRKCRQQQRPRGARARRRWLSPNRPEPFNSSLGPCHRGKLERTLRLASLPLATLRCVIDSAELNSSLLVRLRL